MIGSNRAMTRMLATSLSALALLAGCVYSKETITERQVPVAVAAAGPERVVAYPEGRYVLYGDGSKVPYYWVWMPSGVTAPLPPAPAIPVAVTPASPDRVVTYPEGRYVLYGDGSKVPYYWAWVPTGVTTAVPPAPPAVPVPVVVAATSPERVVTYSQGRYVLYGDGSKVPYYWVWVPSGVTAAPPPAPPAVPGR